MGDWLAIDFGTSNSAAAYLEDGHIRHVALENQGNTIPSAVFFPVDRDVMEVGSVANSALIEGIEGRYMRALKRVLGTSLMSERRTIVGRRLDFYEIIAAFLRTIKERSEAVTGRKFDKVVAGRPVLFDSRDAEKDERAKKDLAKCYDLAGFEKIVFLPEPEAAALSVDQAIDSGSVGIVVDIGGGTSDFSVFRKTGSSIQVVASHGLRLGGTDFDRALNLKFFMPGMGYGQPVRMVMGDETVTAPASVFVDLATWEKIPFLYNQQTRNLVEGLVRDAVEPALFKRLLRVIEMQVGHELAFVAEDAKIASNKTRQATRMDLSLVEPGLAIEMNAGDVEFVFEPFTESLVHVLGETLALAKVDGEVITHVVPVGGSSLMRPVQAAMSRVLPNARVVDAPIFTAIVDGLARRSGMISALD